MILSFGPEAGAVTPTTLALSVPSVVALACYLAAAIPGERFSTRPTRRLAGRLDRARPLARHRCRRHRLRSSRRALRLRAGAVGDALARARRLRAREPLRPARRRAPRARHARRRRRRARLAVPGPGLIRRPRRSGRRCTGCSASPRTACSASPCCTRFFSIAPSGRCDARRSCPIRPRRAFPCCASSD